MAVNPRKIPPFPERTAEDPELLRRVVDRGVRLGYFIEHTPRPPRHVCHIPWRWLLEKVAGHAID